MSNNTLHHTKPLEKQTATGVKLKVKDDHLHFAHYLGTSRSFRLFFCKRNLIPSTAHIVRTAHTRKVGLTAFDTKRWLCEDTVDAHLHGHKDTASDPSCLFTNSYIVNCFTGGGLFCRNDLSGTAPLVEGLI